MWRQLETGRMVHRFEWLLVGLALAVVPAVVLDEEYSSGAAHTTALILNWVIWGGFALELAFVVTVAPLRRAALRAHWLDVAIVLFTAPFLPALLASLRLLRLTRLLRITRLLRLGLLGWRAVASERVLSSRRGFRYIALLTVLLVVIAGFGIHLADVGEFDNSWRGIYWAVVTVTTVGYGDVVPHTAAGRALASLLMLIGIGFLAALTATIASMYVASDAKVESRADADRDATIALRVDQAVIEISQQLGMLDTRLARIEEELSREK